MTAVLLDTNVLVYAFDRAEPEKRARAINIILELQINAVGCLSVQCLSEFFNAVTRGARPKLPTDEALQYVQDYLLAFPTYPLTPSIVMLAARSVRDHSLSFYDAQIWACALLMTCQLYSAKIFKMGRLSKACDL